MKCSNLFSLIHWVSPVLLSADSFNSSFSLKTLRTPLSCHRIEMLGLCLPDKRTISSHQLGVCRLSLSMRQIYDDFYVLVKTQKGGDGMVWILHAFLTGCAAEFSRKSPALSSSVSLTIPRSAATPPGIQALRELSCYFAAYRYHLCPSLQAVKVVSPGLHHLLALC